MDYTKCPACDHKRSREHPANWAVRQCVKCEAVYGQVYLGESYALVLPYMAKQESAPETWRYYDFTCLGSKGITRRHGWYDPASRLIMQVG